MAQGNVVDVGALGKAGFASTDKGGNLKAEEKRERLQGAVNTAYTVLGHAAIGQIKQSYNNLQEFRNLSDSQTAVLNLQIDKMPKDNVHLEVSIKELNVLYRKAARQASLGFGKKRSQGKQDMVRYMTQMKDLNSFLEIYKVGRENSQSMATVLSGVAGQNNKAGSKTMNPGTDGYQLNNTLEQANGLMGKNLRWDIESGQMKVLRNGVWKKDKAGNDIYAHKVGSGTYEEYAKEYEGMTVGDKGPGTRYGKEAAVEPMSREDWTEVNQQNQPNQGLQHEVLYSDLRFAVEEDNTMETDVLGWDAELEREAFKDGSKSWDFISNRFKLQVQGKIDSYSDDQFRDYYFGGFSFDTSTNRMTESAPAYQKLLAEDIETGKSVDGNWQGGYGPGSANWEGRLLALKGQSFVKGSRYRKEATESLWGVLEKKYKDTQAEWTRTHPKKVDNSGSDQVFYNGYGYLPKTKVDYFVNSVKNGDDEVVDIYGQTWNKEDNKYSIYNPETKKKEYRTRQQMISPVASDYSSVYESFGGDKESLEAWNNAQNVPMVNFKGKESEKEPVNRGPGTGTKEDPINLKKKGGNFEEGNWYIRDNGKISLWTKRGWAKE